MYFYTNFVSTIDGKVWVRRQGYWPIGSKIDFDNFTKLRAKAGVIVDGKNTALMFGKATLETLKRKEFKNTKYVIISRHKTKELDDLGVPIFKSIPELLKYLEKENLKRVFINGGPTLLGTFIQMGLVDEIFLTIAPKFFGNKNELTLTLGEGGLLPPDKIKKFKLVSVKKVGDEVFLRYKK